MSLHERIRDAKAARDVSPAVRLAVAAAEATQRVLDEERRNIRQVHLLAEKQRAEQKAALNASLKDLLKMVGVRELLREMRKTWRAGKIDKTPQEISDVASLFAKFNCGDQSFDSSPIPTVPGMALALRHRFRDAERHVEGEDSQFHSYTFSYWSKRELVLYAIVAFGKDELPFVTTLYGSQRSPDTPSGNVFWCGSETFLSAKHGQVYCVDYSAPETIFPNNPNESRQVLEEQLFNIGTRAEDFLKLEDQAKQRIISDWNLPGRARGLASPHWYRRALAQIPVLNLP